MRRGKGAHETYINIRFVFNEDEIRFGGRKRRNDACELVTCRRNATKVNFSLSLNRQWSFAIACLYQPFIVEPDKWQKN